MEQLTLPVSEANIKPAVQNVPLLLLAVRVITHVCLQVSSPPSPPPPEELSSNLPLNAEFLFYQEHQKLFLGASFPSVVEKFL